MLTAAGKDFNTENRKVHADIAEVFGEVFKDNMTMSHTERSVLQDFYSLYADECLLGTENGYDYRLAGILDWLKSCRKIDEDEDEELSMLMNRIEKVKYE